MKIHKNESVEQGVAPYGAQGAPPVNADVERVRMKLSLAILLAIAVLALPALSAEYQFDIPGAFLVSVHGTLHVTTPEGWSVATAYSDGDTTTNTPPPRFPGPMIEAKNTTGAEIKVYPMDIEERSVIAFVNERLGKDSSGAPLPWTPIQGPYAKGSVCFQNPASPTRAHGYLETGRLLLSFVSTISDTNDWQEVQSILESFRFKENEDVQQAGPAYPPQGVGSADP